MLTDTCLSLYDVVARVKTLEFLQGHNTVKC